MKSQPAGGGRSPLLVCVALRIEARAVRAALPDTEVAVIGIGAKRVPSAAALRDRDVVLAGFGGALVAGLVTGDVVVASEIRSPDAGPLAIATPDRLLGELRAADLTVITGPLLSSPKLVHGRQRADLAASGVIAVDMESRPLARLCDPARFAVLRVIVDTPARGLVVASVLGGLRAYRALRTAAGCLASSRGLTPAVAHVFTPAVTPALTTAVSGKVEKGS